jgi:glycerol-3-phosphate acyltransferase PlsY
VPVWLPISVMAYLVGSVPFGFLLARRQGIDLRRVGSGNVGATNALRSLGMAQALMVAALDAAKGAVAVVVAERWPASAAMVSVAGIFAVIGHVAPIWLGFRGGKGVATGAGVLAVLTPTSLAAGVAVFVLTVWATRYVSLGSCVAAGVVVMVAVVVGEPAPVVLGAAAITGLVWVRHRENLTRLLAGSEPRLRAEAPRTVAR